MTPPDYSRLRQPQRFIDGFVPHSDPRGDKMHPCPIRPDMLLFQDEGPHATTWLAVRGDTVRLRRVYKLVVADFAEIEAKLICYLGHSL